MRPVIVLLFALALIAALAACSPQPEATTPVARGEQIFRAQCLGCHAVAADAPAGLGPNLAGVATQAAANGAGLSASDWMRRAIVNPNAEIAPGYQAGLMPSTYGQTLSAQELDDLVAYLLTLE